ncbi:hypothetical protein ES708_34777 [subsurface metagenome]
MPSANPIIELVNAPVPAPSVVLVLNAIVGFVDVLQHTPRVATFAPPSLVTFPPEVAVVLVIPVIVAVVTVGGAEVVKLISFP